MDAVKAMLRRGPWAYISDELLEICKQELDAASAIIYPIVVAGICTAAFCAAISCVFRGMGFPVAKIAFVMPINKPPRFAFRPPPTTGGFFRKGYLPAAAAFTKFCHSGPGRIRLES